jgi:hypothetical protein
MQDRLEKLEQKVFTDHEKRITQVETRVDATMDDIREIKDNQKWATRYTIATLITVVITLVMFLAKFPS